MDSITNTTNVARAEFLARVEGLTNPSAQDLQTAIAHIRSLETQRDVAVSILAELRKRIDFASLGLSRFAESIDNVVAAVSDEKPSAV